MGIPDLLRGKEEFDILQLRQQLKDRIRKDHHIQEAASAHDGASPSSISSCSFGSFFGHSEYVIARRLTQEVKFLPLPPEVKNSASQDRTEQVKSKSKFLRQSRDYSFLISSDEVEIRTNSKATEKPKSSTKQEAKPMPEKKTTFLKILTSDSKVSAKAQSSAKQNTKRTPEKKTSFFKHKIADDDDVGRRKRRHLVRYDDDDDVMVSTFDDILKEERKSAKIGRKEDEIERLMLEQQEKRERLRKANRLSLKMKKH